MPVLATLLDLLFPRFCIGCRRHGTLLCASCAAKLERQNPQECAVCRLPSLAGTTCHACAPATALDQTLIALRFDDPLVQKLVHLLKYRYVEEIADHLGAALVGVVAEYGADRDALLAPIPLHSRRERTRGFNQSALLARAVAARTGRPVSDHLLVRRRTTSQQAKLNRDARLRNLRGAFAMAKTLEKLPRSVMLVDDVVTTGATLEACARTLKTAGVQRVSALAVARGTLRNAR